MIIDIYREWKRERGKKRVKNIHQWPPACNQTRNRTHNIHYTGQNSNQPCHTNHSRKYVFIFLVFMFREPLLCQRSWWKVDIFKIFSPRCFIYLISLGNKDFIKGNCPTLIISIRTYIFFSLHIPLPIIKLTLSVNS